MRDGGGCRDADSLRRVCMDVFGNGVSRRTAAAPSLLGGYGSGTTIQVST